MIVSVPVLCILLTIAQDWAPRFAASHLGLFCLPMSHKKNTSLICVNSSLPYRICNPINTYCISMSSLFSVGMSFKLKCAFQNHSDIAGDEELDLQKSVKNGHPHLREFCEKRASFLHMDPTYVVFA